MIRILFLLISSIFAVLGFSVILSSVYSVASALMHTDLLEATSGSTDMLAFSGTLILCSIVFEKIGDVIGKNSNKEPTL